MKGIESFLEPLSRFYDPGEKTLLAFSGGADSTALFYLLLNIKKNNPSFYFEVFHLNHQLRVEAERDVFFVKNLCEKNQIICHLRERDVGGYAKENKMSLEEAGRKLRYQILYEIRKERNLDSVTTAHHRDDQTESFLMHLFQGSGPGGLVGMKQREGALVRPLLDFSKNQIEDFLQSNKIPWRTDETNLNNRHLRNRVRNILIPEIEQIFPAYEKKISQFRKTLRKRENFIKKFLPRWKTAKHQVWVFLVDFRSIPSELCIDGILEGLKTLNPDHYISFKNLENLEKQIRKWGGEGHKIFYQSKNFIFLGTQNHLFFVENGFFHNAEESFVLEPGESKFLWKREVKNNSGEKVVVRPPMPGEKAYFRHSKKVKDFLIDQKVFYHWRSHVKVLETVQGGFLGIIEPVGEKIYLNENGEGKIGFSGLSE